jgi:hypothetical protein
MLPFRKDRGLRNQQLGPISYRRAHNFLAAFHANRPPGQAVVVGTTQQKTTLNCYYRIWRRQSPPRVVTETALALHRPTRRRWWRTASASRVGRGRGRPSTRYDEIVGTIFPQWCIFIVQSVILSRDPEQWDQWGQLSNIAALKEQRSLMRNELRPWRT